MLTVRSNNSDKNLIIQGDSIGGRNLLLDTGKEISNANYSVAAYYVSNAVGTELSDGHGHLVPGEQYTVSMCITPASGVTDIKPYVSSGNASLATIPVSGTNKQTIKSTFTMPNYATDKAPSNGAAFAAVTFYRFPSSVTGTSTIHWVKIERGPLATDWSPAPEDTQGQFNDVLETSRADNVELENRLNNKINQSGDNILESVENNYVNKNEYNTRQEAIDNKFVETTTNCNNQYTTLNTALQNHEKYASEKFELLDKYIRFEDGVVIVGERGASTDFRIAKNKISFYQDGAEIAYFQGNTLYVTNITATNSVRIANFAFVPRANGSLDFKKVG